MQKWTHFAEGATVIFDTDIFIAPVMQSISNRSRI